MHSLAANALALSASDPTRVVENITVDGIAPVSVEYRAAARLQLMRARIACKPTQHGKQRPGQWEGVLYRCQRGMICSYVLLLCMQPTAAFPFDNILQFEETIDWWVWWFSLEDQMPNEAVIQHRIV
eukprot:2956246-Pleurochrysis_carterae.AAC.1